MKVALFLTVLFWLATQRVLLVVSGSPARVVHLGTAPPGQITLM